jgi:hypothetical protein
MSQEERSIFWEAMVSVVKVKSYPCANLIKDYAMKAYMEWTYRYTFS